MKLLMCKPTFFDIEYAINVWMDVDNKVNKPLAMKQWTKLKETLESLGNKVDVIEPAKGLPDMVFTANGGMIYEDYALVPHFYSPERQGESVKFEKYFSDHGFTTFTTEEPNEAEGDCLWDGTQFLAGFGFRSTESAWEEAFDKLDAPYTPLRLVDPRWYHIDTALSILGHGKVAYVPEAFDAEGIDFLENNYKTIRVNVEEASSYALNNFSDGKNVVLPQQAKNLIAELESEGYKTHPLDMSEFLKSGGGIKCCILQLEHNDYR